MHSPHLAVLRAYFGSEFRVLGEPKECQARLVPGLNPGQPCSRPVLSLLQYPLLFLESFILGTSSVPLSSAGSRPSLIGSVSAPRKGNFWPCCLLGVGQGVSTKPGHTPWVPLGNLCLFPASPTWGGGEHGRFEWVPKQMDPGLSGWGQVHLLGAGEASPLMNHQFWSPRTPSVQAPTFLPAGCSTQHPVFQLRDENPGSGQETSLGRASSLLCPPALLCLGRSQGWGVWWDCQQPQRKDVQGPLAEAVKHPKSWSPSHPAQPRECRLVIIFRVPSASQSPTNPSLQNSLKTGEEQGLP